MKVGRTEIEITTPRPARPSLWEIEHYEHTPEQLAEMAERIRGLARPLIYATNAEDDDEHEPAGDWHGWHGTEPCDCP